MTQPTPSAQDNPQAEHRRAAAWAVPQLMILGVALATMPRSAVTPPPVLDAAAPPTAPDSQADPRGPDEENPPPNVTGPDHKGPLGPLDLARLLHQHVLLLRAPPTEKQRYSDLISLLRRSSGAAISLVNVWSPGCEPCKREFAGFRELLATRSKVRFISIQLGKDDPGELLAALPTPTFDLHDIGTGAGKVREALAELGLARKNATIPITMLLDCRHRLRWIQTQEITDMAGFAAFIDERLAEIPTLCPPQAVASPADTPAEPTGPICGDQRCEAGEDHEHCCTDCKCPTGSCRSLPGRSPACLLPDVNLMD